MPNDIKSISNPRLKLEILSPEEIDRIHLTTLDIVEKVGVRFPSQNALEIWESNGAQVDWSSSVVKIPSNLLEEAIRLAPPVYTLSARQIEQDLPLDGNHVYLGTDGCGVEVIDLNSGSRRRSCLQDVVDIARVADYTSEIGFHWVAVSAQDYPAESRGLHEILAIWENSTKHVQSESIYSEKEARAAVEMAMAIAGSKENLRKRPVLSIMQCTTSPLAQDRGSLDAALIFAEAGIPVGFMTFYAAAQTSSDLRTGSYTGGGPEDFLFGAATNLLADFYNLPLSMGSFATGAKQPDWQAGIDNSFSTFMASIVMSDMLLGAGLLHGSRIWSFEQMLMDCEIFDLVEKMMRGVTVNNETLAFETIQSVGPGGNFLGQKHTTKHMRKRWVPQFMDRRTYETWEIEQDGARDWARAKAKEILSSHEPEPLDPKLSQELRQIIASVEDN
jgi:trimethylamine--corrinoid protein Co-methyltransferase